MSKGTVCRQCGKVRDNAGEVVTITHSVSSWTQKGYISTFCHDCEYWLEHNGEFEPESEKATKHKCLVKKT